MTFGALLFSLFAGWKMDKARVYAELTNEGSLPGNRRLFGVMYFMIKWVAPVVIGIVFVTNLVL